MLLLQYYDRFASTTTLIVSVIDFNSYAINNVNINFHLETLH